jgi:hypothetical protein
MAPIRGYKIEAITTEKLRGPYFVGRAWQDNQDDHYEGGVEIEFFDHADYDVVLARMIEVCAYPGDYDANGNRV